MYEGTKENRPGALNVKAGVKTREHDSRREHRMSRESPGYYFGKRELPGLFSVTIFEVGNIYHGIQTPR